MKTYLNFGAIVLCITCASYAHAQSVSEFKDVCTIGDTKGESPYHGITYYKLSIDHNHGKATASACTSNAITHPVHIIKVDLQAKGVEPLVRAEGITSTITTIDWAKKSNIIAAINTGFGSKEYNSECENSNSRAAIGYQKSNGKDYSCYVQLPDFPIVGLDKLNHFREIPTAEYGKFIESEVKATLHNAVSAYVYTLVKDGKVVSNTDDSPDQWLTTEARMKDLRVSTHPRTAIGVDKTGRYFYLVVVDGRRKNMTGMNIEELSYCMKNMGAYNAYNLDGGGSSTIVLGDAVKNYPSDYPDDQTSCGNNAQCTNKSCTNESKLRAQYVHLGFKAEKKCTASEEICNNIDDDCNGDVDENMVCDLEDPTYQSMIYDPQNTDVDGDGKADICARGKKGIFCVFTSKDLMTLAKVVDMSDEDGWIDASRYATIRFADFNGDGKADVCSIRTRRDLLAI